MHTSWFVYEWRQQLCVSVFIGIEHVLALSCQSTSLCLGDKVRQLSEWLFGGCFDWHVALKQQKSASRFPGDTTCLAQGAFVRSIFISLLLSQPISSGHSVRHHLSLTVKLSKVCVSVYVCLYRLVCLCFWVHVVIVCHIGVPRTVIRVGSGGMSRELNVFRTQWSVIKATCTVAVLDWFAESQWLVVNIKPANGFNLNMLLINTPQSINVKILWKL